MNFSRRALSLSFLSAAFVFAPSGGVSASVAAEASHQWAEPGFLPLTEARIAALPEADQAAWTAYWRESKARQKLHEAATTTKKPEVATPVHTGAAKSKGLRAKTTPGWFATEEARALADQVAAQQAATGGWTKGNDYSRPLPAGPRLRDTWSGGTFDNDSTVPEIRWLAATITAAGDTDAARVKAWRDSFDRGLAYVFAAQFPNGGFPQVYPLVGGYHDAVTFNDNAMVHALELLRDIAANKPEFSFLPDATRREAGERFLRGVGCVLAAQIREADGRRTVWCQQHDPLTLAPCAARNFEPAAACTAESCALVDLLIPLRGKSPKIDASIEAAVAWFERAALREVSWDRSAVKSPLAATPGAPLLWARMHELATDKPIFGDRDRSIHYDLGELSAERQHGYAWFGDWPSGRIEKWKKLVAKDAADAAKQAAKDAKSAKGKAPAKP